MKSLLIIAASVFAVGTAQANESVNNSDVVTVRCGTGDVQYTVDTNGFVISQSGEVYFNEDASVICGESPGGGGEFPAVLVPSFTISPATDVDLDELPVEIEFSASIIAFSNALDECKASMKRPGSLPDLQVMLSVNNNTASHTWVLGEGSTAGSYRFGLECTRIIGRGTPYPQVVIVNNPQEKSIELKADEGGGPGNEECQSIPSVFEPVTEFNWTSNYQSISELSGTGGWAPPSAVGAQTNWRYFTYSRNPTTGPLSATQLRTWKFVAPASTGSYSLPHTEAAPHNIVVSVSKCQGDFIKNSEHMSGPSCINGYGALSWSTKATAPPNVCKLVPGETYYLNVALFDLAKYHAGQGYEIDEQCAGDTDGCQAAMQWKPL